MADEKIIDGQPEQADENASGGTSLPRVGVSGKINLKRERFLILLKDRYGYTNVKAIDEMERLLKQFSITNKSFKIQRTRRNSKPPFLE